MEGHPRQLGHCLLRVLLQVPANRIGAARFSPVQLKVIQEIITLIVFGVFITFYFGRICAGTTASPGVPGRRGLLVFHNSWYRGLVRIRSVRMPQCPSASRNFSASSAAMQPEPAAVIACRYRRSCTSPQANTPGTTTPLSVVRTLPVVLM